MCSFADVVFFEVAFVASLLMMISVLHDVCHSCTHSVSSSSVCQPLSVVCAFFLTLQFLSFSARFFLSFYAAVCTRHDRWRRAGRSLLSLKEKNGGKAAALV